MKNELGKCEKENFSTKRKTLNEFLNSGALNSYYRYTYHTDLMTENSKSPSGYFSDHDENNIYYLPQRGYFSENIRNLKKTTIHKITYSNKIYGGTVWKR